MAAEASCMLALVRAPDALYIPNGWWHEVFTPQFALSVNCWFASAAQARASLRPTKLYCFQESYAGFVRRRIEERTARWQQEQDAGQQQCSRLTSRPLSETQEIQQIIDRGQAFLDEFDPDLTYIETARYRDEEEESDAEVKEGQGKEEGVPELAQLRVRRDESLQEAQRLEQEAALAQDEAKEASKRAKAASEKAQAAEEMEMSMAAKAEEAARDAAEAQALAKEARDIAERDRDAVRAAEGGKAEL